LLKKENEMFPAPKREVTPERLPTLGQAYLVAKALAPTHPHPHAAEHLPGNVIGGPAIAIVDRADDVVRSVLGKWAARLASASRAWQLK
jgi:hypothetical protein